MPAPAGLVEVSLDEPQPQGLNPRLPPQTPPTGSVTVGGGPSAVHVAHCADFMTNPPGDDWDGVCGMTEK